MAIKFRQMFLLDCRSIKIRIEGYSSEEGLMTTSLSAITSNYGHLNGVENAYYGAYGYGLGYGGYYGGVYNTANAEQVKDRITNNYDIYATQQGLRSKQGVETLNNSQQCNLIAADLKAGEVDQASEKFKETFDAMKNLPQYANYSDSEICALIRDQYATTTGSDMVSDINKNSSGAFFQGFKRGVPLLGLLANKNSSADLISQVTNNDKSKGEKSAKVIGTTLGAATGAAAIVGLVKGAKAIDLFKGIKNICTTKATTGTAPKTKSWAIAAAVAGGIALVASLIQNVGSRKKNSK